MTSLEKKWLDISPADIGGLKRAYNRAVKRGAEDFNYAGGQYLTIYAKYVIQYLDDLETTKRKGTK